MKPVHKNFPLPAKCVVIGCDRKPVARGFCNMHYKRERKGSLEVIRKVAMPPCVACGSPHKALELCNTCYMAWKRSKEFEEALEKFKRWRIPLVRFKNKNCGKQ